MYSWCPSASQNFNSTNGPWVPNSLTNVAPSTHSSQLMPSSNDQASLVQNLELLLHSARNAIRNVQAPVPIGVPTRNTNLQQGCLANDILHDDRTVNEVEQEDYEEDDNDDDGAYEVEDNEYYYGDAASGVADMTDDELMQ